MTNHHFQAVYVWTCFILLPWVPALIAGPLALIWLLYIQNINTIVKKRFLKHKNISSKTPMKNKSYQDKSPSYFSSSTDLLINHQLFSIHASFFYFYCLLSASWLVTYKDIFWFGCTHPLNACCRCSYGSSSIQPHTHTHTHTHTHAHTHTHTRTHTDTLLCYSCKLDCEIDNSCVAIWLPWHLVIRPCDSPGLACLFHLPPPAHQHCFQYKKKKKRHETSEGGLRVWADNSLVLFSGGGFELNVRHGDEYTMSVTSTSSSAPKILDKQCRQGASIINIRLRRIHEDKQRLRRKGKCDHQLSNLSFSHLFTLISTLRPGKSHISHTPASVWTTFRL